jgi:predicted RND superfamily exporter protein
LVIFIVLGIAADDIFVFIDAWRQSEKIDSNILSDKKKRLAYSFRRAVRAMAVTSSTTSVAFFANYFSPLMPIRSFGIFAGIIVPVNYLLVVLMFPPATIFYERYFEGKGCCGRANTKIEST